MDTRDVEAKNELPLSLKHQQVHLISSTLSNSSAQGNEKHI